MRVPTKIALPHYFCLDRGNLACAAINNTARSASHRVFEVWDCIVSAEKALDCKFHICFIVDGVNAQSSKFLSHFGGLLLLNS